MSTNTPDELLLGPPTKLNTEVPVTLVCHGRFEHGVFTCDDPKDLPALKKGTVVYFVDDAMGEINPEYDGPAWLCLPVVN